MPGEIQKKMSNTCVEMVSVLLFCVGDINKFFNYKESVSGENPWGK